MTPNPSLEEAVARALCDAECKGKIGYGEWWGWDDCMPAVQSRHRASAQAALLAIEGEGWCVERKVRTIYDRRTEIARAVEAAAPQLYSALKNLVDAVEERPDRMGIESIVISDAHAAMIQASGSVDQGSPTISHEDLWEARKAQVARHRSEQGSLGSVASLKGEPSPTLEPNSDTGEGA